MPHQLLLVERQVSVAVFLSKQIGGKTAGQNAATELAARILRSSKIFLY